MGYRFWSWVGSLLGYNKRRVKELMYVKGLMEEAKRKMDNER